MFPMKHLCRIIDRPAYSSSWDTDWTGYSNQFEAMVKLLVERVWSALDLDQVASRLNEAIIQSYNDNCPLLNGSRTTTIKRWTKGLESGWRAVRKLFNRARLTGGLTDRLSQHTV